MEKFGIKNKTVTQKELVCSSCGKSDGIVLFASKLKPDLYVVFCENCFIGEYISKKELESQRGS